MTDTSVSTWFLCPLNHGKMPEGRNSLSIFQMGAIQASRNNLIRITLWQMMTPGPAPRVVWLQSYVFIPGCLLLISLVGLGWATKPGSRTNQNCPWCWCFPWLNMSLVFVHFSPSDWSTPLSLYFSSSVYGGICLSSLITSPRPRSLSLLQVEKLSITILEGVSKPYRVFCWGWDLRLHPPTFPSVALLCLLLLALDTDLPLPCLPVWRMLQAQNHLEIIILKTNKLSFLWSLLSSQPHQAVAIFTHPSSWQVSLESHHDISCGLAWHSSKIFFQKHPALEKCQRLWCIHRDVSAEEKIHLRRSQLDKEWIWKQTYPEVAMHMGPCWEGVMVNTNVCGGVTW